MPVERYVSSAHSEGGRRERRMADRVGWRGRTTGERDESPSFSSLSHEWKSPHHLSHCMCTGVHLKRKKSTDSNTHASARAHSQLMSNGVSHNSVHTRVYTHTHLPLQSESPRASCREGGERKKPVDEWGWWPRVRLLSFGEDEKQTKKIRNAKTERKNSWVTRKQLNRWISEVCRFFFLSWLAGLLPASAGLRGSAAEPSTVWHRRGHPAIFLVGLHQGLEGGLGFLTTECFLGLPCFPTYAPLLRQTETRGEEWGYGHWYKKSPVFAWLIWSFYLGLLVACFCICSSHFISDRVFEVKIENSYFIEID